jgi:hypothetical protein
MSELMRLWLLINRGYTQNSSMSVIAWLHQPPSACVLQESYNRVLWQRF